MKAADICKVVEGELLGEDKTIEGFCINSKSITKGQVFVALKGNRHDGHDFVSEAFQKGAVGCIVEKDVDLPKGTFAIKVKNSIEALRRLAVWKRNNFKGKVIALAGSAGKTTTKEMVAFLLSKVATKVEKTPKNFNSQITVPLSVCNFALDSEFWVVEFGASQKGDVRRLTDLVRPHIRAITAIGEEHLETFGCLDDVVLGNGEILADMQKGDTAVYPKYVDHCYSCESYITFGEGSHLHAESISIDGKGVSFRVDKVDIYIPIPSLAVVENALCSFAVLEALGIRWQELIHHLRDFKAVDGRFKVIHLNHLTIIDDAYNANPVSMKKAIESLSRFRGTKIAVLGDMLELGEDSKIYHRQIGDLARELSIDFLILYGDHVRCAYEVLKNTQKTVFLLETKEDVIRTLKEIIRSVKNPVVLVKGSRSMQMEEIAERLTKEI